MMNDKFLIPLLLVIFFVMGIFSMTVNINGNELNWFWSGIAGLMFYSFITLIAAAVWAGIEMIIKTIRNLKNLKK